MRRIRGGAERGRRLVQWCVHKAGVCDYLGRGGGMRGVQEEASYCLPHTNYLTSSSTAPPYHSSITARNNKRPKLTAKI